MSNMSRMIHSLSIPHWILATCLSLLLVTAPQKSFAQQQTEPPPAQPVTNDPSLAKNITEEFINKRLEEIKGADDLDEEIKAKSVKLLESALAELKVIKDLEQKVKVLKDQIERDPAQEEELNQQFSKLPDTVTPDTIIDPGFSIDDLKRQHQQIEKDLIDLKKQLKDTESEPARRQSRRDQIPPIRSKAQEKLDQINLDLKQPTDLNKDPQLLLAEKIDKELSKLSVELEIEMLDSEISLYNVGQNNLELKEKLLQKMVKLTSQSEEIARIAILEKRREEVAIAQAEAKRLRDLVSEDPVIRAFAEENLELIKSREETVAELERAQNKKLNAKTKLDFYTDRFEKTKLKVNAIGGTNTIGKLLRKEKEILPFIRSIELEIRSLQELLTNQQYLFYQNEERQQEIADTDEIVNQLTQDKKIPNMSQKEFTETIEKLVSEREAVLKILVKNNTDISGMLTNAIYHKKDLISKIAEYNDYIDERVLWIRSGEFPRLSDLSQTSTAAKWLLSRENIKSLFTSLYSDWELNKRIWLCAILLFIPLFSFQPKLRRITYHLGEIAQRGSCQTFTPTLKSFVVTCMMAVSYPGLVMFFAWRFYESSMGNLYVEACGIAFYKISILMLPVEFLRQCVRNQGLAQSHFGMPASALQVIRQVLRWFRFYVIPILFVQIMLEYDREATWSEAVGRYVFILGMIVFAYSMHVMIPSFRGTLTQIWVTEQPGFAWFINQAWFILGVIIPVILSLLSLSGFYYTALQLFPLLVKTIWVVLFLRLLSALSLRWVLMNRRKVAFKQAVLAREQKQQIESEEGTEETTVAAETVQETLNHDVNAMSEQTRKFIQLIMVTIGCLTIYPVWNDVFPALRILNQFELWQADAGPVTLSHLLWCMILLGVTFIAAKNVPGMIEIIILPNLPFKAGTRYAMSTLSQYTITVVGIILAGNAIEVGWEKLQWLFAALTVGLGFGMQEIVGNFISGLILLFERPIRVGDVITAGDFSGVVSQIRIRATTIVDWDNKEMIVPNKEFITNRVLNWTLSNEIQRVIIPIGIAYGSDTKLAEQELMKVVEEHPLVLETPGPSVIFEGFGDSTLDFTVRCYLPNLDKRLSTIHELNMNIDQAFREANIEIAFPQRDLNIRSVDPSIAEVIRQDALERRNQDKK